MHFHIGSHAEILKIEYVLVIKTFNLDYEYTLNCLYCTWRMFQEVSFSLIMYFRDDEEDNHKTTNLQSAIFNLGSRETY